MILYQTNFRDNIHPIEYSSGIYEKFSIMSRIRAVPSIPVLCKALKADEFINGIQHRKRIHAEHSQFFDYIGLF